MNRISLYNHGFSRAIAVAALLMAGAGFSASGTTASQEEGAQQVQTNDSTNSKSRELGEVVVEGRTQRVVRYGVEYMPDRRSKKMASDAISLLRYMQIPQLRVSPSDASVTTAAGQSVAIFIDYMPASAQDLRGMRTEDVLRVEVLDYPDDPRFQSYPHVINYIMRKYEWGGYTKTSVTGGTLSSDFISGQTYSKFAYKNTVIDANVSAQAFHTDMSEAYSEQTYRDFYIGDRHYNSVTRIATTPDGEDRKSNNQSASIRAAWSNRKNVRLTHTLSMYRSASPMMESSEAVAYSIPILPSTESLGSSWSQSLSPQINGNYYFILNNGQSFYVDWTFGYYHTKGGSFYQLGQMSPISSANSEDTYSPEVTMQYSKRFSNNNMFRTSLMTVNSIYNTDYTGSSYNGRQDLLSSENMLFFEYLQSWQCGLNLYSRAGVSYVAGRVNGETTLSSWNPRLGFQLQYGINRKNSASLSAFWGNSHPHPSAVNSAIVQSSELMWLMGNPDLKNTLFASVEANYNFIPSNTFGLNANMSYVANPDKATYEYLVIPGYDGLIRTNVNSGTIHNLSAGVSASLKLIDNHLNLQGGVNASHIRLTGIDAMTLNYITCNMDANYYLGDFAFTLYYNSPSKSTGLGMNGVTTWNKSTYGLRVAYAIGEFKANLSFSGWFDSNRQYTRYDSGHYSFYTWGCRPNLGRQLRLTLSYTVPYGKVVRRDNELQTSGSVNSAILK